MLDRFALIVNRSKEAGVSAALQIKAKLERAGKTCAILGERAGGDSRWEDVPEDAQCLLVLGGDGTLLEASKSARKRDIPLLGVNLGTLGYLAEVELGSVDSALEKLLSGSYTIEERMMLCGSVSGEGENALNDIVITRRGPLQVLRLSVYVNERPLTEYHADGIIIATPTGSTGYSLSAGGPIVSPSARTILMTPISPHTLASRSIVLSPDDVVGIGIGKARDGGEPSAEVSFDGGSQRALKEGDVVTVARAAAVTKLLRLGQESFLQVLRNKLS